MKEKTAIIIGAGPAGLTAGFELLKETDIKPIIIEKDSQVGGISKTINYNGNRMDLGGHRFFSKSDRVMNWWFDIMPLQGAPSRDDLILNRNIAPSTAENAPDPEKVDCVMLVRDRVSRIYFLRNFFDYPVTLSLDTLRKLGSSRLFKIMLDYLKIRVKPIKIEKTLQDFFINRFGEELFKTFFKDYTEKLWGVPCSQIDPEFGSQRVKGVSIKKTITNALQTFLHRKESVDLRQKNKETSLIEKFFYPKYGPGNLWETVAMEIEKKGGIILKEKDVTKISVKGQTITSVQIRDLKTNIATTMNGDYFISTMPVQELADKIEANIPDEVKSVATGLIYRDFISVGLLLKSLEIKNETKISTINNLIPDNWIYVQEKDIDMGRIQIFNNWSPYLVKKSGNVWLGLEYFCTENDAFWNKADKEIADFAIDEMVKMGIVDKKTVLDFTVVRVPKAYPAYFGTYNKFGLLKNYFNGFTNLFLIGRNGMHRYNNMDHSMLTAMKTVENIRRGIVKKDNIWAVNAEKDYHEKM